LKKEFDESIILQTGTRISYRPSDRVWKKNQKLCSNFQVYYAEKYVDYAENRLDYAEISNVLLLCELLSEDPSTSSSL